MSEPDAEVRRGAAVYSRRVLSVYDLVVTHLSNSFVWRCHRDRVVALYQDSLGRRHLDVGPGTGWYLAHARPPSCAEVTLLDLNENSLSSAGARLAGLDPRTVVANVLEPLPDELGPFDSIGANYLFHCLPGSWDVKGIGFGHVAEKLPPGGVLFGGTILGRGVRHNAAGRALLALYNRQGIFHNREDDAAGLDRALRRHFDDVRIDLVGAVALFRATGPKPAS